MARPSRCSRSSAGWRVCRLVSANGAGRERRQLLRGGDRAVEEQIRLDHLVDQSARSALLRRIGRAAEQHLLEVLRRRRKAHDLEGDGRERHADQQLGDADAADVACHQPLVAGAGEHAAAGDGMAVDRGDDRLREREDRLEHPVQRRQEFPHIGRAAVEQPQQIDAGREHPSRSR